MEVFEKSPRSLTGISTRRTEALERKAARAELSPTQQLAELDKRLGKGKGAKKERARLEALLNS